MNKINPFISSSFYFFYPAMNQTSARFTNRKSLCEHREEHPIRFYVIEVRATEFDGNFGLTNNIVIVVPRAKQNTEDPLHYANYISTQNERIIINKTDHKYSVNSGVNDTNLILTCTQTQQRNNCEFASCKWGGGGCLSPAHSCIHR